VRIHSLAVNIRRKSHWGWGFEDQRPDPAAVRATAASLASHLGLVVDEVREPVPLERAHMPAPRIGAPAALAEICASDAHARASHAQGKSYADVVNGFNGRFEHAPDFVARPRDEADLERLLEWCSSERVAATSFV